MLLKALVWVAALNLSQVCIYSKDISRVKRSHDDLIPCEKGWFHFRNKCYKLAGTTLKESRGWYWANLDCKRIGSGLVTIQSEEENDFLTVHMILDTKTPTWIGLNDRSTESEYIWSDGTPLGYKNWKATEPDKGYTEKEDCVEMIFEPENDAIGKWNDAECSNQRAYICEAPISETSMSPNPTLCSVEEGGGWKFQNSCFHVVTELKSWEKAERHCKDVFDGHLAAIVDRTVDIFLSHLLSDIKKYMWIGIKIQNQVQQQWTSGWFVSYDGLNYTGGIFLEEMCVLRHGNKQWTLVPCSKRHSFICEKSKDHPPVLKPAAVGSYCPKEPYGWRDLHGEFCYFIELEKTTTWNEANFDCLQRGGNLLSLHSQVESDILFQFIKYRTYTAAYIGLYTLMSERRKFAWSDGSAMDWENWSRDEPNGFHEKCGEVLPQSMKWNDVSCDGKRFYFCKAKKTQPSTTAVAEGTEHVFNSALIGVAVIACAQTLILMGITIYYFRSSKVKRRRKPAEVPPPLPPFPFTPVIGPRYTTTQQNRKDDDNYEVMRVFK